MSANATGALNADFRTLGGVSVRCADSGGSHERTILLTSPWPESIFAFARMWAELGAHARLFAIDLPGFGASEARRELFSPRAMGRFLAQLIQEAGLGTPYVVGPDVGTSAALFAAADHPDAFAGVIVGTGGAAIPLELGEPLKSWVLDPDLEKYRAIDPHAIVKRPSARSRAGSPTMSAPTTSTATPANVSWSRWPTSGATPRSCPYSRSFSPACRRR